MAPMCLQRVKGMRNRGIVVVIIKRALTIVQDTKHIPIVPKAFEYKDPTQFPNSRFLQKTPLSQNERNKKKNMSVSR